MQKLTTVMVILVFVVLPVTYAGDFAYNRLCSGLVEPVDVGIVSPVVDSGEVKVMSLDKGHYEIHEQDHYFVKMWFEDVGGVGSTTELLLVAPNGSKVVHGKGLTAPDTDFTITLYENITYSTPGMMLPSWNNDRNSLNVAESSLWAAPNITDYGYPIWSARNGGGRNPIGVANPLNYELLLKNNTDYVFVWEKQTTADSVVDIDFWWYEETYDPS